MHSIGRTPDWAIESWRVGILSEAALFFRTKFFKDFSTEVTTEDPELWNALPRALRNIDVFENFKSALKTHLFRN